MMAWCEITAENNPKCRLLLLLCLMVLLVYCNLAAEQGKLTEQGMLAACCRARVCCVCFVYVCSLFC
jgi:hypothetical protein